MIGSDRHPSISVIIATYNRAALLDECLRAISRQPFGPADEVIVVDNGSTDGTAAIIARHAARFPAPLIGLYEPAPGKSRALARALGRAAGDVFAFTDDDVNVGASWLDAIRRTMAPGEVALMGGPVAPRWERRPPRWLEAAAAGYGRLTAPLALLNYGPAADDLGERSVLGANMAVRRDVFQALGGFAPHLGKLRGTLLSGEDHDLCRRVRLAGLTAIYSPDPVVEHWVPADRMRVGYFLSWFFWSGITNAALDGATAPGRSLLHVPLYIVRRLITGGAAGVGAALCGRWARAVEHGVDAAFAAGYAAQRWGLARTAVDAVVTAAGEPA